MGRVSRPLVGRERGPQKKAGDEIHRIARWSAITEWCERDVVADRTASIPTSMFANEHDEADFLNGLILSLRLDGEDVERIAVVIELKTRY